MKPYGHKWTEADLHELITRKAEEGLRLDFKDSRALSDGGLSASISKDVAAFANADGGHLIFGINEKDKIAIGMDDGCSPSVMTAERLEDVISGNVTPVPSELRVCAIELSNGNNAFVVEVPAATVSAPHQSADKRYYRRYMARNLVMDHHEILDLMRRGTTPAPELVFEPYFAPNGEAFLDATIYNRSPALLTHALIFVGLDKSLVGDGPSNEHPIIALTLNGCKEVQNFHAPIAHDDRRWFRRQISAPPDMPVFREAGHELFSNMLLSPVLDMEYRVWWSVACPGASIEKEATLLWTSARKPRALAS
jgi:hypothetical protein